MLSELEIPFEQLEFQSARLSVLTPDKIELMEVNVYKGSEISDVPDFYVATWRSAGAFARQLLMMQLLHQRQAERVGFARQQLTYTWNAPPLPDDYGFGELNGEKLKQFLSEIVKTRPTTNFVRLDGVFFGLSIDSVTEPKTTCFASFFRLPSAVSAMWAASDPSVGGELNQEYVENLVAKATDRFPDWHPGMYEKLHGKP
jgi:hypothetical protein